ncbi:N-acetylglucosamine kinase [Arthrobacter sp. MA-N2]|uniref:N-acetylglucosamine kinase n=1 Tax=Arthrobacter sp. MA-N2 TaxID=1101188 RepID=UPI000485604B|nr:BadF/BadG/BcrA/BcrD ATPase family protein [Arthrobacter sp. MA-N2]
MTHPGVAGAVIGLDIGGSKTRGITWLDGTAVADTSGGSANVQNVSRDQARINLEGVFASLNRGPVARVVVGSGGIDTAEDANALTELIQPLAPDAVVSVVHDTRLLLAAAGYSTGIAVIAGTGSAAWGTNGKDEARAGGWGYLLGDEGSGYWFAREAVRYSLDRMNHGLRADELTKALVKACGLSGPEGLIALFHSGAGRGFWASKSPVVFECAASGHAASLDMILQAGADLASLAAKCAEQLKIDGPIVLGGGLGVNQPTLQTAMRIALCSRGLGTLQVLTQDPVFGALHLASN